MRRFPSICPSIHPSLCLVCGSSISPMIPANVRNIPMPFRASLPLSCLSVFLICTFICLVFFHFVVLHLTVSHTVCFLSLSFCQLQCATEIFALKNTDELLPTLIWLLWCALEVARVFWVVAKQLLKHSWWLLGTCWPVAKVL